MLCQLEDNDTRVQKYKVIVLPASQSSVSLWTLTMELRLHYLKLECVCAGYGNALGRKLFRLHIGLEYRLAMLRFRFFDGISLHLNGQAIYLRVYLLRNKHAFNSQNFCGYRKEWCKCLLQIFISIYFSYDFIIHIKGRV